MRHGGYQCLCFIKVKPHVLGFDVGLDYQQLPTSPETSQKFTEQNGYKFERPPYNFLHLCVHVCVLGLSG